MRTVSYEMREVQKRFRAISDALHNVVEPAKVIGPYTASRFQRASSALAEAADCISYTVGHVESHMEPELRDRLMQNILDAMRNDTT